MQRIRLPAVFALISAGVPWAMISPLIDDRNAVGQRVGLLQIMRRQQHRLAATDHPANLVPQHAPRFHVEPDRRLVQKNQIRIAANRQRKQHALPLPAREIAELAVAQFFQTRGGQHFRRAPSASRNTWKTGRCARARAAFPELAPLATWPRFSSGFQDSSGRRRKHALFPNWAGSNPSSSFTAVVLPAPFGPSKATTSPARTRKSTPRSARTLP